MSRVDLYTPWRDPGGAVRRHVGRGDELDGILGAARGHLAGSAPNWVYVFGPRGVGKSHLLTLVHAKLEAEHPDVPIDVMPEDVPALRSAATFIERIEGKRPTLPWLPRPAQTASDGRRRVVFLEGLDRHLKAMDASQRRELRRLLDQRPNWWIAATGVTLPPELTQREEAFYQHFNPWPLAPLEAEESTRLLEVLVLDEQGNEPPGWQARRDTLVTLAGGNPRALVALAVACRQQPRRWASSQLHGVVQDFTAHYQMRFRDLSAQQQEILELLSMAHRELTPKNVSEHLRLNAASAAVQLQRLTDAGVVSGRSAGRQTFYGLTEPLFGYWLEYRSSAWDQTLASWLTRLLETLLSPSELAFLWLEGGDAEMRAAAARTLAPGSPQHDKAWKGLIDMWAEQPQQAARRATRLAPHPFWLRVMVADAVEGSDASTLTVLHDHVSTLGPSWDDHAALVAFREALQGGERARSAFIRLVERLGKHPASADTPVYALEPLCNVVTNILASDHRRGRPWKLRGEEQQALGRVPYLRATYLRRGRLGTHPPLLDKRHLSDEARSADAAEILSVAISRGDQDLAEQTAARMKANEFDAPPAHAPAHLGVRSSEEIARALGRGNPPAGLCWMAWTSVCTHCSDEAFEGVLKMAGRAQPYRYRADAAELALASLRHGRADRFERLAASVRPEWLRHIEAAQRLVALMSDRGGSRLSAPLEQLRLALTEEPRADVGSDG